MTEAMEIVISMDEYLRITRESEAARSTIQKQAAEITRLRETIRASLRAECTRECCEAAK